MKNLINTTQANGDNQQVNGSFIHVYHRITREDAEDTAGTLYSNVSKTE